MTYEVERRARGHFKMPSDFVLDKEAEVRDTYFLVEPNQMRRLRRAVLFPTREEVFLYGEKTRSGDAVNEVEFDITKEQYHRLKSQLDEVVLVAGHRIQYRSNGTAICTDEIYGLGKWTEVEIMTPQIENVPVALERVRTLFFNLGVSESDITSITYPELLQRTA